MQSYRDNAAHFFDLEKTEKKTPDHSVLNSEFLPEMLKREVTGITVG